MRRDAWTIDLSTNTSQGFFVELKFRSKRTLPLIMFSLGTKLSGKRKLHRHSTPKSQICNHSSTTQKNSCFSRCPLLTPRIRRSFEQMGEVAALLGGVEYSKALIWAKTRSSTEPLSHVIRLDRHYLFNRKSTQKSNSTIHRIEGKSLAGRKPTEVSEASLSGRAHELGENIPNRTWARDTNVDERMGPSSRNLCPPPLTRTSRRNRRPRI